MKPLRCSGMDHTVLPANITMPASACPVMKPLRRSGMDHTVLPANVTMPASAS